MPPITPELITSIAFLFSSVVQAGINIEDLFDEIEATGRISPEQWAEINARLAKRTDNWDTAAGPAERETVPIDDDIPF